MKVITSTISILPLVCLLEAHLVFARSNPDSYTRKDRAETSKAMLNDFRINDDTGAAVQERPALAMTPGGYAVACWCDKRNGNEDIYFQIADNVGRPVKDNQLANDDGGSSSQRAPDIAVNKLGQFVIVWQDSRNGNSDIYGRRFAANGTALGASFKVNDDATIQSQNEPAVAMDSVGNFIVCWADNRSGSGSFLIYAQRYDSTGAALGTNFQVAPLHGVLQVRPAVAMNPGGDFVIAWMESMTAAVYDVFAATFNRDGSRHYDAFEVSTHPDQATWAEAPAVALKDDGEFMICWHYAVSGGHNNVYGRAYRNTATAYGDPFMVNQSDLFEENYHPAVVAINRMDLYLVVWNSTHEGTSDIYGRYFDSSGVPRYIGYRINDVTGSQRNAAPAFDERGIMLFVWEDDRRGNADIYGCWIGTNMPLNFTVGSGFDGCVPISWSHSYADERVVSYRILRSLTYTGGYEPIAVIAPATRPFPKLMLDYIDTDVENGTTYYYIVTAEVAGGEFSERQAATPSAAGHTIRARWAYNAVTIDGQIASGEWNDARAVNIANPDAPKPIFLYLKNDHTRLYLAVDDPNDVIVDPANILYFVFDQDNDNRWDPSGMVTEGAIAFNSSAVAYSSYGGDYPETFTMAAASVPTGVAGVLSAASGHVQYELSLDLTTSPLTAGPGETIGAFIWVDDPGAFYPYHVGNAGEWPAGALWDAATSLGNLTLAREPGPVVTNFDWPMVNGGPLRWSWAVGETQLYPPFGYTADFSIGSATAAYPVYFDNTLYASLDGFPNRLIAYDVKSQTELWHFDIPYSDGDCLCTPAVNDCTVFIGGQLGRGLYALNRWTGEQKWLKEIGSLFRHHPIVDETFVYVLCHDSLYCLRADHGRTVWSYPAAVATNSSYTPLVDGQQVYAVINGELWAFEKQTGAPRWHVPNDYGSLVADADLIYSIHGNQVMARTKTTGTLFWAYTFPDALIEHVGSVLALSDDALCFALERNNSNSKAELYVLDKATGAYRWHYTFSGRGNFFPTIANDIVYGVLGAYGENGDGSLWGFDINTGGVVFYDHSVRYARQPIVAGHTLFVPSAGVIKAFGNQPVTVRQTDSTVQPQRFALAQNYPNPFNPETVISYVLPTAVDVKLTICNPLGQVIAALVDERQVAGNYRITWNGLDQTGAPASSGLYFCILRCGDQIQSRKILLLK